MTLPILTLAALSFALSWLATLAMRKLSPRLGFVDKPGHRKIHQNPIPLGGGVAIFLGFALPLLAVLALVRFASPFHPPSLSLPPATLAAYWSGVRDQTPLALGLLGALLATHLLGLRDDRRAMGPFVKLFIQLAITTAFVTLFDVRALTFLDTETFGRLPSIALTVLWITAITNAFNFLDNMDGLSAGVAAVCTAAFLATALSIEQWFVAAALSLLLGALLGFLCFNFAPASIFMGDAGSLVIGLLLGVLTVRTTFLRDGEHFAAGWYSLFAPLIVLAVPLYDLIVVSLIRLARGKSPFVGDTNHFSHRLVARGMTKRTAVLTIYLVTAATAVAAVILPHAPSTWVAVLIFTQTLLILGVVFLLERHPLPQPAGAGTSRTEPPGAGPGEDATRRKLQRAGWHPGRDVWHRLKLPASFAVFPEARRVLTEFGDLRIEDGDETVDFDPAHGEAAADAIRSLGHQLGRRLYPVGQLDGGDTLLLLIDEAGVVYTLAAALLEPFASSFTRALPALLAASHNRRDRDDDLKTAGLLGKSWHACAPPLSAPTATPPE